MQTFTIDNGIRTILAAGLLLAAGSTAVKAESVSARMNVSATVVARTLVDVEKAPGSVVLTSDDISRGYIELPEALSVRIRSNARNGYLLRFQPLQGPFSGGEVSWNNNVVQLGSDERWISQGRDQQGPAVMNVRLHLQAGVTPGVYPLNLGVSGDSI